VNSPVFVTGLALSALTTLSPGAQAAPNEAPASRDRIWVPDPTPRTVPDVSDLRINAGVGASSGKTLSAGIAGSIMTTYRYHFVEGGLLLEGGSEFIGGNYGLVAGVLGPVWQSSEGPRLELLAVGGRSGYSGVGCNLFCDSGGGSAEMPFLGARAGVSYVVKSRKRAHLEIGGSFGLGSDLRRKHVDYTTTGGFLDDGTPTPGSTMLGGVRSTAMFVIGTSLDLGGEN
jgi:hypothetical protein